MIFYENTFPYKPVYQYRKETFPLPLATDDFIVPNIVENLEETSCQDDQPVMTSSPHQYDEINDENGTTDQNASYRHSSRQRRPPSWMEDYVINATKTENLSINLDDNYSTDVNTSKSTTAYTPCTYPYMVSQNFSSAYVNFLANTATVF